MTFTIAVEKVWRRTAGTCWRVLASALLLATVAASSYAADDAPAPYGAVPSVQQMMWHKAEMIGFVHFGMNTFTNREWGDGKEAATLFNPTNVDCDQWVKTFKSAGFGQVILTAKHHDGFCLWQTDATDHSVKSSPWKGGKGDVVKEFTDACKRNGMHAGIYLSPWDRNSPVYGDTPAYNALYAKQLTELLTKYGPITEVWFDGANGEGPNGKKQVYDWPVYRNLAETLAPNCVMFSGSTWDGRSVRWGGNEAGSATETNWCTGNNERGAKAWIPAECDASIRPGWFYHPDEDAKVKTVRALVNMYFGSVGRNGVLLLNIPPDPTGRLSEVDVKRLGEFHAAISSIFANNLAAGKPVTATDTRGPKFSAANLVGTDYDRYWAVGDKTLTASVTVDLGSPKAFNTICLQEYIPLGQRVAHFTVDGFVDGNWMCIGQGTTIGYKRILPIRRVTASRVRVTIDEADAPPVLTKLGIYDNPLAATAGGETESLIAYGAAKASNVYNNQTQYGADKAVDGDDYTRWATDDNVRSCWMEVDAGRVVRFDTVNISEIAPRITSFRIEYRTDVNGEWKTAYEGQRAGEHYKQSFAPVEARYVRLNILAATSSPSIWEFKVFGK
ncbi:MAG TPA: alpha-L-fucosidase [Capsulimonadaceae bacterium]|jgi:alpha-L-fucosidase